MSSQVIDDAKVFSKDIARVIHAGAEVVQDHVMSCQQSVLLAEKHVRQRAIDRHHGLANAWMYFASPAILDLARALHALKAGDG